MYVSVHPQQSMLNKYNGDPHVYLIINVWDPNKYRLPLPIKYRNYIHPKGTKVEGDD